ncbi:MAG: Amuc_1099 family pilus-like system protein [bacterium]
MTTAGVIAWLRRVYDRLAAAMVLLVLVVALFMLAVQAQLNIKKQDDFDRRLRLKPLYARTQPMDRTVFQLSRLALTEPVQIGEWPLRLLAPELRVLCVNCERPIPYAATTCSFCKSEQIAENTPDLFKEWLTRNNLNPLEVDIGSADTDGDGFSNREEYDFRTSPNDPSNHPPPLAKITVQGIRPISFRLVFMSVNRVSDDKRLFQINLRSGDRTWWKSLGEKIEGFELISYDEKSPEGPELTLQRGDKKIPLIKGRAVPRDEYSVILYSQLDGSNLPPVRVDEEFTVKGAQYKVKKVDRDGPRVLIHDTSRDMDVWIGGQLPEPLQVPRP